jgi:uncharacterized protein YkwD
MMRAMWRRKMAAMALTAGLLAGGVTATGVASPAPVGATEASFAPAAMWYYLQAEEQFLAMTNQVRASVGVGPLVRLPALDDYARGHALWMAQTGLLQHSNIGALLGPYGAVAENISMGYTVESMEGGLAASPPHFANMTNAGLPYTGVGVVWSDGVLWTVHVYAG